MQTWITNELGGSLQIWDSEWGYSSTVSKNQSTLNGHNGRDRERQATLAVRETLTVWALGFPLAVWYDLRDDGNDPGNPEQNYGLLDSSGNEKPSMRAIRNLMNSAKTRTFAGMLSALPSGLHAMRFNGAEDELLVIWTDDPEHDRTVEFNPRDLISVTDIIGRAVKTKSEARDYLRLRVSEHAGPIYLLLKTGSPR
jgi:hypothetical protein